MFSNKLQLVCTLVFLTFIHSVQCQANSTATEYGIVSAAGGPNPTQSVSYIIEGSSPTSTITSHPSAITTHSTHPVDSSATSQTQNRLSIPAIIAITLTIVFGVVGIILFSVYMHKTRCEAIARAQRRTILDAEFAASREKVQYIAPSRGQQDSPDGAGNIGYFDVAKPLPVVQKEPVEDDRLSRSSTIIADAAEVAKINRMATDQQEESKKQRSTTRERNHALQALVGTADCGDSKQLPPPRSPDLVPPALVIRRPEASHQAVCTDGNGDAFAERPEKI